MNAQVLNMLLLNSRSVNLLLLLSIFCSLELNASDKYNDKRINNCRWNLNSEGGISWIVNKDKYPHTDHIEMSGKRVSVVLRYGVNQDQEFELNKSLIWPLLRTIPNNTHASLMRRFNWNPLNMVLVNGKSLDNEKVEQITLDGLLRVESLFTMGGKGNLKLIREYFPSVDKPALVELYRIINPEKSSVTVEIPSSLSVIETLRDEGVDGSYRLATAVNRNGSYHLAGGDTLLFTGYIAAYKMNDPIEKIDGEVEKQKRVELISFLKSNLVLETPNDTINRMFAFSKIRACESIFETKGGPLHGPGGESYYAAIWANDQAEYVNPYFPFVGYAYGNKSALNSFMHFSRFMNEEWKPIPSSIIAEGLDIWNGAGDRGDAAMIAYGASRYALASGKPDEADKLWPLIEWCLTYCNRNLNKEGVVLSDTDELENRFPSGDANLCTSSLYYDALLSAAYLCDNMGKPAVSKRYRKQAAILRESIEAYFGATVEGFDTYAYFKGNDVLRSWICIPLTVGINERADATIKALFSPRLWTENGLLTQAGSNTFWDRSTLYALRGVYTVGATKLATDYLNYYSKTRLLGEHVPYAIEAWPEGGQRHLSAESGLFGRVITEGLFGIRPTGFKSFIVTPRLPEEWDRMALRRVNAFDTSFDIEVKRLKNKWLEVTFIEGGKTRISKIKDGASLQCKF